MSSYSSPSPCPSTSGTKQHIRRICLSPYLISFLSFSLVGFCSSEALVSSATSSFVPRSLWAIRGGSEGTAAKPSLTCVLQMGVGDEEMINGSSTSITQTESKIKGVVTDTIAFVAKRKNGAVKLNGKPRNGKSTPLMKPSLGDNIMDIPIPAKFIAETNLPTDVGQFRLRAYRTEQVSNIFCGNEPCVIYSADRPPFGNIGEFNEGVPVRIHDQCMTSEVFRSKRWVHAWVIFLLRCRGAYIFHILFGKMRLQRAAQNGHGIR